jgi:hypothetical protein
MGTGSVKRGPLEPWRSAVESFSVLTRLLLIACQWV